MKISMSWDFERNGWMEVAGLGNRVIFFESTGFVGGLLGLVGSLVGELHLLLYESPEG